MNSNDATSHNPLQVSFPIIDQEGRLVPTDRRRGERREWSRRPRFPLKADSGEAVERNRRRTVERRDSAVEVTPRTVLPKIVLRLGRRLFEISGDGEVLTVGRAPDSDILIDEPWVSRQHACILREGDHFLVTDDSRNGTSVRGDAEQSAVLHRGELELEGSGLIRFGAEIPPADATDVLRYAVVREL